MAKDCDEQICPLIDRIDSLERKYEGYNNLHTSLENKIDRQSNQYTSLSARVEETATKLNSHMTESKDRDATTHSLLKYNNESLSKHMEEETKDRQHILDAIDKHSERVESLAERLTVNETQDKVNSVYIKIMWTIGGVLGVSFLGVAGWMAVELFEFMKLIKG